MSHKKVFSANYDEKSTAFSTLAMLTTLTMLTALTTLTMMTKLTGNFQVKIVALTHQETIL
jgi:hypothetical protein